MATPVDELSLPKLDFFLGTNREDRRKVLRTTAKQSWLAQTDIGYTVLTYETIMGVLRDKRWHSATGLGAQLQGITNPEYLNRRRRVSILNAEGDVHVRLRRLVAPAFSPRSADRLRPFMRDVVNELVDPLSAKGSGEIVQELCEPYPIPIICELLGAPKEDWQSFSKWATDVLRIFSENLANELDVIMKAQDEINAYTRNLIEQRRSEPREDLLTDLIAAEEEGDRLTSEELEMMVEAVIIGGTDTTRNQLGLALVLFANNPEQWSILRERPELAPRAVEEVMRYHGAVGGTI
ncbi:MAG: cytochrome P450, partial [Acidimicrobiaceae bacterium]